MRTVATLSIRTASISAVPPNVFWITLELQLYTQNYTEGDNSFATSVLSNLFSFVNWWMSEVMYHYYLKPLTEFTHQFEFPFENIQNKLFHDVFFLRFHPNPCSSRKSLWQALSVECLCLEGSQVSAQFHQGRWHFIDPRGWVVRCWIVDCAYTIIQIQVHTDSS